jgi:hypothetical protein
MAPFSCSMSISRGLPSPIASQCRGIEALVESSLDVGTDGPGFEVDDLAAVAEMLFHQIRAIVDIAAQFQAVGCHFPKEMNLFTDDSGLLHLDGIQERPAVLQATGIGDRFSHVTQRMAVAAANHGLIEVKAQHGAFQIPLAQVGSIDRFDAVHQIEKAFAIFQGELDIAHPRVHGAIGMGEYDHTVIRARPANDLLHGKLQRTHHSVSHVWRYMCPIEFFQILGAIKVNQEMRSFCRSDFNSGNAEYIFIGIDLHCAANLVVVGNGDADTQFFGSFRNFWNSIQAIGVMGVKMKIDDRVIFLEKLEIRAVEQDAIVK